MSLRTREQQSIILAGSRVEFILVTSRLARNVHLKINHQNELEVVVPFRFPHRDLSSLLIGKQDWIIDKLAYANQRSKENRIHSGSIINVLGIPKKIISADIAVKTRIKETADSLILTSNWGAIHYKDNSFAHIASSASTENITVPAHLTNAEKTLLETHLRKNAKTYLLERTAQISEKMGTKYYRVAVRAQRSRWGSCSRDNNLNFNWKLIFMPLEVIDYIIIHELAHTVHHNHGPHFHALVEKHCPNYKELKKTLKNTPTVF
jgi:hypothetical protein